MSRLDRLFNIDDVEAAARKRLPGPIYDIVAGGAADEITLRANREALASLMLRPRTLRDLPQRDLSTTVLGQRVSMPVLLAPVGFQRMLHRDAELASARAAAAYDTIFACNTISTFSLEEVAASSDSAKWFQLYLPPDRGEADELMSRVEAAGYPVVCLTVDVAACGREIDTTASPNP